MKEDKKAIFKRQIEDAAKNLHGLQGQKGDPGRGADAGRMHRRASGESQRDKYHWPH
jgi:hypothetical protein